MKYAVVIEKGPNNYSAYVPDLPGCVTAGKTLEEIRTMLEEAIPFHIEGLQEDGDSVPEPTTVVDYVDVPVTIKVVRRQLWARLPSRLLQWPFDWFSEKPLHLGPMMGPPRGVLRTILRRIFALM